MREYQCKVLMKPEIFKHVNLSIFTFLFLLSAKVYGHQARLITERAQFSEVRFLKRIKGVSEMD